MKTAFPNWTPERVIAESVSAWNRRHPDNLCDAVTSDWVFVCNVISSWGRHGWSDYEALVTPENHDALRDRLYAELLRTYPWMRRDPRKAVAAKTKNDLAFDDVSRELSALVTKRSDAILALKKLRRARPVDRSAVAKLQTEVNATDQEIQELCSLVQPDQFGDRHLAITHDSGDYFWAGHEMHNNYIEPVPEKIRCIECDAVLWRTKRAVNCGGGIKNFIFSCHCTTRFGVDGHYDNRWWLGAERQEKANNAKQFRIFLRRVGLHGSPFDRFHARMIKEGLATWDGIQKTLTVDCRHIEEGKAYRLEFRNDGSFRRLPFEGRITPGKDVNQTVET